MNTDKTEKTEKQVEKKTKRHPLFYEAVGRRKEATVTTRLYVITGDGISIEGKTVKKGEILVNGRMIEKYFPGEVAKKIYLEPFRTTNTIGRFAVSCFITGGGPNAQLHAFIHSSSRALQKVDQEKFHPVLKKKGFLTRDSRMKQRRKAGYAQKARARKQSPKR